MGYVPATMGRATSIVTQPVSGLRHPRYMNTLNAIQEKDLANKIPLTFKNFRPKPPF